MGMMATDANKRAIIIGRVMTTMASNKNKESFSEANEEKEGNDAETNMHGNCGHQI